MSGRYEVETVFTGRDDITPATRSAKRGVQSLVDSVSTGVGKLQAATGSIKSGLAGIGVATAALGAGAGMLQGHLIDVGATYQEQISAVGAGMLKTVDEIKELDTLAQQLGADTKFTATEAAAGMELMVKAGFETQDVIAGIGGVLDAAAASGEGLAETSGHVSNVLKGMGLATSEAAHVADVLALASVRTNSSIGSLGESMKNLAPVARQFGVPIEEAVGMVAMLQDVGLDASEAGTATATMLTKLTKPSKEVAAQMRAMNIEFKDSAGNMLAPIELFEQMLSAADQLGGNADKVAFFADLVGLRGQKAALNLQDLFTSSKGQQLITDLKSADGVARRMSELRMDNFKGDVELLSSTVDGLTTKLFTLESDALRGVVSSLNEWVEQNDELIQSGFSDFLAYMMSSLPEIIDDLKTVGIVLGVFFGVDAALKAVLLTTQLIAAAQWIWNAAVVANPMFWGIMATFVAPLVIAVGVIWGIIEAVIWLAEQWDHVVLAIDKVLEKMSKIPLIGGVADLARGGLAGTVKSAKEKQKKEFSEGFKAAKEEKGMLGGLLDAVTDGVHRRPKDSPRAPGQDAFDLAAFTGNASKIDEYGRMMSDSKRAASGSKDAGAMPVTAKSEVDLNVNVRAEPGTEATVDKQPKAKANKPGGQVKARANVQRSGALK